jgi:transposase
LKPRSRNWPAVPPAPRARDPFYGWLKGPLARAISYSTLRDFARKLRPARPPEAEEARFETPPA